VLVFKKILLSLCILFSIQSALSAAVFDYRFYYSGISSDTKQEKLAYSVNVYSYFFDNDFSFGAQEMLFEPEDKEKSKINSASFLLGYDINSIFHIEGSIGSSLLYRKGQYYKGIHYGGTILAQSNFDSFLEAIQFGVTYNADKFKNNIKIPENVKFFIGLGF